MRKSTIVLLAAAGIALQACGEKAGAPADEIMAGVDEQPVIQAMKIGDPPAYAKVQAQVREISNLPEEQRMKALDERLKPIVRAVVADHLANLDDKMTRKVASAIGKNLIAESDKPGDCDPASAGRISDADMGALQLEIIRMKPVRSDPNAKPSDPQKEAALIMEAMPRIAAAAEWNPERVATAFQDPSKLNADDKCRFGGAMLVALSKMRQSEVAPLIRSLSARQNM